MALGLAKIVFRVEIVRTFKKKGVNQIYEASML